MSDGRDDAAERDEGTEIEIEVERDRPSDSTREPSARDSGPRAASDPDSTADRLGDELGRVDLRTTPEGYVEGRVTDLESVDGRTVRLEVSLPHGEVTTFDLEKPIPWSREFLLARIVEDVGYDASSIDHLVGESVYLTRADLEDAEEEDWLAASMRAANEALAASLPPWLAAVVGGEADHGPEWRLVDPRERPEPPAEGLDPETVVALAAGAILLGALFAILGAVVGATGGLAVSAGTLGYALPGFLLVLVGLAALLATRG